MATYTYTHNAWGHAVGIWYAEVTESEINESNNTSKITIKFYVKAAHNNQKSDTYNNYPAGYGSSTPYSKIYIDGTCVYTVNPAKFDIRYNNSKRIANGTTYNLGTYSKIITHDEDGSKSLKIKCQHYTSVSPGYATCEGTFTCAKINVHRQTYLTVPNSPYDIGSSMTIQANPKSTEYTHALNVSLDNSNWVNIQNSLKFKTANANNSYKFTIPTEFKNSIGEQKTGTMYVKLSTWINGSYIGVETKTVPIRNSDQNLRASYLIVPSGIYNIGSNITVQGNPCKADLTHKLLVSTDNASWITVKEDFKLDNVNANNPITFTIPNDLKTLIPAKSEGTIYVSLSTYNNGFNLGYERKTVKIYNDSDKSTGTFEFSNKMINTNGKYYYSDNKKIITDLFVSWDYMPYSVGYNITGPNGYTFSKGYQIDYVRGSADNSGDWYILWKDQSRGSGTHQYISPTLPGPGTYTITVQVNDGRALNESWQFKKSITINIEDPSILKIDDLSIDNESTYMDNGKYIINKSNPKVDVTFYTDLKISNIEFKLTGANSIIKKVTQSELNKLIAGKSHKVSMQLGELSKAGTNNLTVTISSTAGKIVTKTITFQTYNIDKYLSIQDSYIDNTLARDLKDGKYFKDTSRLGLKIKISNSHTLISMTVKIDEKTYNLNNYMYNNASYTCPDTLPVAGDCKITITVRDILGQTDSKTMTLFVYDEVKAPPIPKIRFEFRMPKKHNRHFYFSEGEHVIFTGTSDNIEDYQIIYALAPCDIFNAFSSHILKNSYADEDSDFISDRLEKNISDDINYYIYKDFDEGGDVRPICKHPTEKYTFRLYDVAPDHNAHEEFFALQWFEHAEPGDVLFIYVRERKKKVAVDSSSNDYLYSDSYNYDNIPKKEMFPMCVLPPMPSQIQLYEQLRDKNKLIIEYTNPIYELDSGIRNPIHLIDVCLIAKDKNGKILNGSELKKRDGRGGRSWVYYSDRKWHSIVPWRYSKVNNKEKFTMEFDISKYDEDAVIYVVAFYYNDFYRHPSIYSTSNILQSKSKDLDFKLSFIKPENNSKVNTPNPLINIKMTPTVQDENAIMDSIYSDIDLCKHWIKHKNHWHLNPIWLHHWPRPNDHCFPHFHINDLYKNNCFYDTFTDCPLHRIEHYFQHKLHYFFHHKCHKIPDKPDVDNTVSYNECCLFLSSGDKEINLGDINIDELQNEEKIFSWVQDSSDTFLSPGNNIINAYTYPYDYNEEKTKNEVEVSGGHWHNRCSFISDIIMKCHPSQYKNVIVRPRHVLDWHGIEKDVIKFKIPYRRLIPNHDYVLTFKTYADYGFLYPDNKLFEVDKKDVDNDLLCGAYLDIIVHHDSVLINLDYESRYIIYQPQYHIIGGSIIVPCINNYKKEILHTVKFKAPAKTNHFLWDVFFDIVVKARGVHKLKVFSCKLRDATFDTEEDVTVEKILNKTKKEHEVSINVNYDFKIDMKDVDYINPLSYNEQMALRNYLLNMASECGITNVQPGWRNYNSSSYLEARDFNDIKDYCYELFTEIKNKYPNTFKGDPNLFKDLPTIVKGDKRGPRGFFDRGMHYFYEWDDLVDNIKKQTFGEYTPSPKLVLAECTGVNILNNNITIPQNGRIGDTYCLDYEIFPSNCMEEVIWITEDTEFINVNNGVITRTVNDITDISKTTRVIIKCGSYSDSIIVSVDPNKK